MPKFMLGLGFGWLGGTIFTILWRAYIDGTFERHPEVTHDL